MVKRHILPLLAACFLASTLAAAEVKLGAEIPLWRDFTLEPVGGGAVAVAANGSDSLLVWHDSRAGFPRVWATRVDGSGHTANPAGIYIADGADPLVARAVGGYLIVWADAAGLWSVLVDANGNPAGAPRLVFAGAHLPTTLQTNGTSFLLIYNFGYNRALLGPTGAPLPASIDTADTTGFMGAAVRGNQYVVAAWSQFSGGFTLYTIGEDGAVSTSRPPLPAVGPSTDPGRVAFGETTLLAIGSLGYAVAGYDGMIVKTAPPPIAASGFLSAAWDGHEFLAVYGSKALRVGADGTPIDASPFSLSPNAVGQFTFATGGGGNGLVAWNDGAAAQTMLVGRAVHDFDALAAATSPPANLAVAPKPQIDTQVAFAGATMCSVWSDRYEVRASFDGTAMTTVDSTANSAELVGWAAVAAGNSTFLVVWRHKSVSFAGVQERILARRYDLAGHALDGDAIVLDGALESKDAFDYDDPPAVSFDGSTFLVAWGGTEPSEEAHTSLHTVHVDEGGGLSDRRDTRTREDAVADRAVRILPTGSEFVLVHLLAAQFGLLRVDSSNTAISQAVSLDSLGSTMSGTSATLSPDGINYAFLESCCNLVSVAQTRVDGSVVRAPHGIARRSDTGAIAYTDIAWDGSHYVLVWLDSDGRAWKVRAIRLDRNLNAIDAAPFDVFSVPGAFSQPKVVPTATGTTIVYSHVDDQNGGAARAFLRSLDAVAAPPSPDLTVAAGAVGVTPATVTAGTPVTVSYQIKNIGNAAAAATVTHVEITRDSDHLLYAAQDFPAPALASGDAVSDTHTLSIASVAPAGVYTVTVTVDHDAVLAQSYTANDTAVGKLTILAAPACTFAFDRSDVTFPAAGGSGSVNVIASDKACGWNVASREAWLTITSGGGTGSGTITFAAAPNSAATPRTTTISLGNATVVIHQDAAVGRRRAAH